MKTISFVLNGARVVLDIDPETPLLWALRDYLKMTGTKFGCGIGACGACTVHVDGNAIRSCSMPVGDADGATVKTIEGLAGKALHPLQKAWIEEEVPQCGYCQSGQIMAAAALLMENPNPNDDDIKSAMTNICRCGTYPRIKTAIKKAAREMAGGGQS